MGISWNDIRNVMSDEVFYDQFAFKIRISLFCSKQ